MPSDTQQVTGKHPVTPDGRYFVVSGRLWRMADPSLPENLRQSLVNELMAARRGIADARKTGDIAAEKAARAAVHVAKVKLGERGPTWWTDGAPDLNRHLAKNTPYSAWHDAVAGSREPVESSDVTGAKESDHGR